MTIPRPLVLGGTVVLLAWIVIGNITDITPLVTFAGPRFEPLLLTFYGALIALACVAVWIGAYQHLDSAYNGTLAQRSRWRLALYVGLVFTAVAYVLLHMRTVSDQTERSKASR